MNLVLSLYSPYAYKTTWRTTKLFHLLRTFFVSLDSNKRVHGMFTLVISNVQDGFPSPLKSVYWLKTINICSTTDNCSGNTVPSVFLIHTNRWSATINDIGISVSTRCSVTWNNWIYTDWPNKPTFCIVKHIRRNFYTKWVVKNWFSTHFNIGFLFANL